MKKEIAIQEKRGSRRKKLIIAVMWLLVSSILLTTVSYAWLVMSVAPEVTGISTNIGSNGSLEMALLNPEGDLDAIRTIVGTTLSNPFDKTTANTTWGNLVDLNDESYGLNHISLLPTRLNYNSGIVNPRNLLLVPEYAYDGRIIDLNDNAMTAIFDKNQSSFAGQGYGVRAVGTSSSMTAQSSALSIAKSAISSDTSNARVQTIRALNSNIQNLMNLVLAYSANRDVTYDKEDIQTLRSLIADLQKSTSNIDSALRQGLIAYAAHKIEDVDKFETVRSAINNTESALSALVELAEQYGIQVPSEFKGWVNTYTNEIVSVLDAASNKCNEVESQSDVYTWSDLREILNFVMDLDNVYFGTNDENAKPFASMSSADFLALMGQSIQMTLAPGSGVFATVADFTGNLVTKTNVMGTEIAIETMSDLTEENIFYLVVLKKNVDPLNSANGEANGGEVKLDTTYGYVIDLAFRCNAAFSDLLLQTEAKSRVDKDETGASTMGGGSYMQFSTSDNNFTATKMIELMDAIRVTFIDQSGNILGVAKLNTSNHQNNDGVIKAPLYLYDYEFSADDGFGNAIVMGERRKGDNVITALPQNEVVAVSAVVWLDGDIVDNTMVSAEEETSLNGVLNLQFASSADLVPAENADLFYAEPSKTKLQGYVDEYQNTFESGQQTYTTDTWAAFAADYQYAKAVLDNYKATDAEVYRAQTNLPLSFAALKTYTVEELETTIAEIRKLMGKTDKITQYVLKDGDLYYGVAEYTEEMKDNKVGEIYSVNFAKNLVDKGNGVSAPQYSESSWTRLALALYEAEIAAYHYQTNPSLQNAYDALIAAKRGLTPYVYYTAYFYNDHLYYYANTTDDSDTYGKWYYSDRTMVVADLLILKLDAKKEAVDVASIKFDDRFNVIGDKVYVAHDEKGIVPYVELLKKAYPELSDDDILAIQWSIPEAFVQLITASQEQALNQLIQEAEKIGIAAENVALQNALNVLGDPDTAALDRATATEANVAIDDLIAAINDHKATLPPEEPVDPELVPLTANQYTVLEEAIRQAKLVANFDDPDALEEEEAKAKLLALIEATENAEVALRTANNPEATETITMAKAQELLDALNTQLKANDKKEVTEYNTIKYQLYPLPYGYFDYDYGYTINHEMPVLNVNTDVAPTADITGEYKIFATVYTKQGVVCTIEKTICIYAPAEDVKINAESDIEVEVDSKQTITISLIDCKQYRDGSVAPEGTIFAVNETISSCTWASEDTKVVTVSGSKDGCTITAVAPGTARITVTVTTEAGNEYFLSFYVTVNEAPQA